MVHYLDVERKASLPAGLGAVLRLQQIHFAGYHGYFLF